MISSFTVVCGITLCSPQLWGQFSDLILVIEVNDLLTCIEMFVQVPGIKDLIFNHKIIILGGATGRRAILGVLHAQFEVLKLKMTNMLYLQY